MSTARLPAYQGPSRAEILPGAEPDPAAPIRDRLALERQRLDAVTPEALDLAAELLYSLHQSLRGEMATLAPLVGRTDRYLRGELLGERTLPVEDLCGLAVLRPRAVSAAVGRILVEEPDPTERVSLGEAGAHLARSVAELLGALLVALDDGRVTLGEVVSLSAHLDQVERDAREARVALLRRRP